MIKGRAKGDAYINGLIQEAYLCKLFRCSPSELRERDWDEVELHAHIFSVIAEKNPMFMFM